MNKGAVIRFFFTLILLVLAVFANFVSIRLGTRYAIEVNFYDKLAAAHDIGGIDGLKAELAKIASQNRFKNERLLAEEFQKQLPGLKDPAAYVDNALAEKGRKIILLKNLRSGTIWALIGIFLLKLFFKRRQLKKNKA